MSGLWILAAMPSWKMSTCGQYVFENFSQQLLYTCSMGSGYAADSVPLAGLEKYECYVGRKLEDAIKALHLPATLPFCSTSASHKRVCQ